MPPSRSRALATRAAIYADAVSEHEAAAHQNIADDVADLTLSSLFNWQVIPGTPIDAAPDFDELFASTASTLSHALEGGFSAHLQALFAARGLPQ